MRPISRLVAAFGLAIFILQPLWVQAQKSPEDLQKETVEACKATAKTKPTFATIQAMVDKACTLLEKEGTAAFPKFKGKDSEFIFCGTYIWINDLKGVMRMHPAIPQMEGMDVLNVKDNHGKKLFFEFNKMAKEKGAGWVDYWWPKPGEPSPSRKISYVKLCKAKGEDLVVGSGVYDLPDDQVDKLIMSQETPKELAKETESAIVKTNVVKATSDMVIQKVNQACELLEKEGKAAFPKFKGKKSEFIFAGTYIWINDLKGVMIMHPVMAQLEGKDQIGWQDSHGKLIFVEFNKVAKEKGSGWVDYWWPKPGEKKPSHKISFVKLCKIDGEDMVVGCGIYDLWDSEIAKLVQAK
ncbi:MAG: cache domain-containing protein [Desulfobaccales bacterium]